MKNQMNRIKIAFITLLIVSVGTFKMYPID